MQRISRAPGVVGHAETRLLLDHFADLDDLGEAPVLRLRERARLDDADDVADLRLVLLVVGVELASSAGRPSCTPVRLDRVDLDDDRLVHRGRDDGALALLAAAALALRLRQADDRLALGRLLALRPCLLRAESAREALASSASGSDCAGAARRARPPARRLRALRQPRAPQRLLGSASGSASATGSSATGSSATGSSATGSSATGSSAAASLRLGLGGLGSGSTSATGSSTVGRPRSPAASAASAAGSAPAARGRLRRAASAIAASAAGSSARRRRPPRRAPRPRRSPRRRRRRSPRRASPRRSRLSRLSSSSRLLLGHLFWSPLPVLTCLALVAHGQDAGDLALRGAQPRAVLERAGRGLEAEVEELLARLGHLAVELLVGQVTQLPSSQRDQPPASRTSSSRAASGPRGAAPPWRAARARRPART